MAVWQHEKSGESFCIFHQTDAALHVEKAFFINGSQVLVGVSFAWAFAEPRDVISEAEREVTVAGIVTDEEGNHVIAASVLCPAKGIGTISDADGRYVVTVGKNDTIHIQMSGYQSRKVCVGNREIKDHKVTINVQLNH